MSIIALMLMVVMAVCMTACGKKAEEQPAEEPVQETEEQAEPEVSSGPELSEDQMDDLYDQAAAFGWDAKSVDSLPDKIYGHAEPFSIERDGDKGTWYVYLCTAEYVVANGKAYNMSGAAGEAILKFDYTAEGPKLTDVIWSADGTDHDQWVEENFSEEALEYWKNYEPFDEKGKNKLMEYVDAKAEKDLGVPVSEDLLEINDDGTYTISKVIESGDPADGTYKFDTEVIDEGKVEDLK